MEAQAGDLAARLGLRFSDLGLLQQALVHSSYTNEQPARTQSNDRLEFLGDAVVSLVISEALFSRHPDADEGELTTRRAAIVSAAGLARIARRLDLGEYVLLGAGATLSGERARNSILAGAFEALTGAVYVEHGIEATREWLLRICALWGANRLSLGKLSGRSAFKSRLQELAYARTGRPPHYRLVSAEGPHHDRLYQVDVELGGRVLGHGSGRNRREAETEAADEALTALSDGAE